VIAIKTCAAKEAYFGLENVRLVNFAFAQRLLHTRDNRVDDILVPSSLDDADPDLFT
jgi:hypothetical protein